jgi:hypothetical protein
LCRANRGVVATSPAESTPVVPSTVDSTDSVVSRRELVA